jgi:hypothetical protein
MSTSKKAPVGAPAIETEVVERPRNKAEALELIKKLQGTKLPPGVDPVQMLREARDAS